MNSYKKMPVAPKESAESEVFYGEGNYPFYLLCFFFSAFMLLLMPSEVGSVETEKGWFIQPYIGPVIGLTTMLIFSVVMLFPVFIKLLKTRPSFLLEYFVDLISDHRVPIITSFFFFIYINLIDVIGFLPASYLFVCTLLFLSRLITKFWALMALITVLAIILIFRVGIGLWLDDVWLYEFLPTDWADFANRYL
ncbi:MAG: hypothetical protein JXR18_05720 [Neptuniibacter sp.]